MVRTTFPLVTEGGGLSLSKFAKQGVNLVFFADKLHKATKSGIFEMLYLKFFSTVLDEI